MLVGANTVETRTMTSVTAEAPLYDTAQSADGGCGSSGCVAVLTRVSLAL
ncbi:unnamed protein product, partial [Pylaiella littoralis]